MIKLGPYLISAPIALSALLAGASPVAAAQDRSTTPERSTTVVVTATRTEIRPQDAPSGYSQITREDIDRQPVSTLADLLQDISGLALDQEMDGRSQIRVRGFEPSQTLVLINGRRINNTDALVGHSDFRMTQIPTAAIERVEVVRGPTSSLYGADALGGVVNAIIRPPSEQWTGRLHSRVGYVHRREGGVEKNASLYTAGPITDRVGALLSVDVSDRSGSLNPDNPGVDEIEGRRALAGFGSVFYRPAEGHELEWFYSGTYDEREARRGAAATRELDVNRYSTGVRYDFSSVTGWKARADVYRARSETDSRHTNRQDQHTDDIVDLSGSLEWAEGHTLTLGADYRREHFWRERQGELEHDDQVAHRGVLAQNRSHFLDDRWIVTLGARFDDHTHYTGEISPRMGVVYALTEQTRLKADYGRGFGAPDLRRSAADYDFTFPTIPLRLIGNPDLEPERSDSFSVAWEYQSEQVSAGVTLFRNNIKDLIDLRCIEHCPPDAPPEGENELRIYTNVDAARTQGAELELGYYLDNGARMRANYTYLDARNQQTGETLESRPRQRLNLLAEIIPWLGAEAYIRTQYMGSQRRGSAYTRDYTLFHLGLSQRIAEHLTVRAGIENLTDQRLADLDDNYTREIRGRFFHTSVSWEF